MKVYSIGRETGCDIVINDNTNVISRRHAVLNVTSSGKMTIVDQSQNGTYVNGIRISSNVPVPVTRKDNISFAHVARLDWNFIADPRGNFIKWGAGVLIVIALIIGAFLIYNWLYSEPTPPEPEPVMYTPEEMERRAKEKSDSIQKEVRDSIRRDSIRRDSIKKAKDKVNSKKIKKDDSKKADKKPTTKKEEPKKTDPKKPTRLGR